MIPTSNINLAKNAAKSAEISADIDKFLASGGEIEEVPYGTKVFTNEQGQRFTAKVDIEAEGRYHTVTSTTEISEKEVEQLEEILLTDRGDNGYE
jgi:uncharacterized protein YwgA